MSLPSRPLVVTSDPGLLDELLRIVAIAGSEVDVAVDPVAARQAYASAPVVLIGADQVAACVRARLASRTGVIVVSLERRGAAALGVPAGRLGAEFVTYLPEAQEWLVDRIAQLVSRGTGERGRIVAVIGGRGGAGASTLAAGLAVTAVRHRRRTMLVDADPRGGGIDLVLGWEDRAGLRWQSLTEASGRVDEEALCRELPGRGDLVVLSWGRSGFAPAAALPPAAMTATLDAGRRGRDLTVVDVPRTLDETATSALAMADVAVLVVPAEVRATVAAAQLAGEIARLPAAAGLVVRGPAPGRLTPEEVAQAVGVPLLGYLKPEPGLATALERGEVPAGSGRGPLAELCDRLLQELP